MENTSFDKIIDKVFDGFKKITPALVAVAVITGLILFLPINLLTKLGLNDLPATTISIIGMIFLLSASLIVTILGSLFFELCVKKIKYIKLQKELRKKYLNLSLTQKKIIIKMMKSTSKSIELDGLSGDTLYLRDHNFIYKPGQFLESPFNQYTYVPHPWLIDLYQKEPDLFNIK